jgi:hypothetical protein
MKERGERRQLEKPFEMRLSIETSDHTVEMRKGRGKGEEGSEREKEEMKTIDHLRENEPINLKEIEGN